jgi:hypothetical protein
MRNATLRARASDLNTSKYEAQQKRSQNHDDKGADSKRPLCFGLNEPKNFNKQPFTLGSQRCLHCCVFLDFGEAF